MAVLPPDSTPSGNDNMIPGMNFTPTKAGEENDINFSQLLIRDQANLLRSSSGSFSEFRSDQSSPLQLRDRTFSSEQQPPRRGEVPSLKNYELIGKKRPELR
mmetsp:Transcript_10931/g.16597  ORF Transcript_10931/g.16597 Transcript_10931/m.16597 type:complete len:102 (+) Transcript_10931:8429-8734(+)